MKPDRSQALKFSEYKENVVEVKLHTMVIIAQMAIITNNLIREVAVQDTGTKTLIEEISVEIIIIGEISGATTMGVEPNSNTEGDETLTCFISNRETSRPPSK